jgi:hypothetical protein
MEKMRLTFYRTEADGKAAAAKPVMTVEVVNQSGGRSLRVPQRTQLAHWRHFADFFEIS